MKQAHVVLVSAQPIPNLIPAITWKPEIVHLLVSDKMIQQAARLELFLISRGGVECIKHPIDPYDMGNVESICCQILEGAAPGSITLNATGGTKVAAFGAFAAFRERGFPIIYFDPDKWRITWLDGSCKQPTEPAAELTVREYLAVHGLSVIDDAGEDDGFRQRRELTEWLAKELPKTGFIRVLNSLAADALRSPVFPIEKIIKPFDPSFTPFLEKLASHKLITWESRSRTLTFPDPGSARYLGGFWLEEYVYNVVLGLGVYDVCRNVRVTWDGSGAKPVTNEFDVVFTDRCRLFLISCKTSKLGSETHYKDKNPVYELDSLKDDAAGLFGQGMLVSATPLGIELQKRADTMKLITMSGDLKWLSTKIRTALHLR